MKKEINVEEIIKSVFDKMIQNLEMVIEHSLRIDLMANDATIEAVKTLQVLKDGLPESLKKYKNFTNSDALKITDNSFCKRNAGSDDGKYDACHEFIKAVKLYYNSELKAEKKVALEKIIQSNKKWTIFNATSFFNKLSKEFTSPQKLIQKEFGHTK